MTAADPLAAIPAKLLAALRQRYAEPQRAYHGWPHILALLGHCRSLTPAPRDPHVLLYAILFHDAVYDPARGDNEARSAELFAATAAALCTPAQAAAVTALILATQQHAVPEGLPPGAAEDAAQFLDMDLSILGAAPDVFDAYERAIRQEYAHVPEPLFKAGRAAILQRFLARDRLFLSAWGQARFEAQARSNLRRSLQRLGGGDTELG